MRGQNGKARTIEKKEKKSGILVRNKNCKEGREGQGNVQEEAMMASNCLFQTKQSKEEEMGEARGRNLDTRVGSNNL